MLENIDWSTYPVRPAPQFKVGDKIDGFEIIEVKNTVDGFCTYASSFVVKATKEQIRQKYKNGIHYVQ